MSKNLLKSQNHLTPLTFVRAQRFSPRIVDVVNTYGSLQHLDLGTVHVSEFGRVKNAQFYGKQFEHEDIIF